MSALLKCISVKLKSCRSSAVIRAEHRSQLYSFPRTVQDFWIAFALPHPKTLAFGGSKMLFQFILEKL